MKREISRAFTLLRKSLPSLLLFNIRTANIGIDRYKYEYLNPNAKANGKKAILLTILFEEKQQKKLKKIKKKAFDSIAA